MTSRALQSMRVALLHQGAPVPHVGGVIKPMKPGGYSDSSADIAYALKTRGINVITPASHPDVRKDLDWSFPDTPSAIRQAVTEHGVNVFWANTILHSKHAIVELADFLIEKRVKMVGQSPLDTEKYDDKEWLNRWLVQSHEGLQRCFAENQLITAKDVDRLDELNLPAVIKPVRGRGSHGVKVVRDKEQLKRGVEALLKESDAIIYEEFLEGEETTITVMPPGEYTNGRKEGYWALPVVTRFDQVDDVAPWNGTVPVMDNSRALTPEEHAADPAYGIAQRQCELVAEACQATAPIRIDCRRRRRSEGNGGEIILFDVNMKPNATGTGRPGREKQTSLVALAAEAIGWDYPELCVNTLAQAVDLKSLLDRE
ncbi:hypothetical protein BD324DRAFT_422671 [Kockovaella imperatae]|uniref:ATP-grasp domain-containing protein n=1 Tax=Kockovaella imperatae TaxID=4999 RepID=A0A1Y1UHU4_9TREE|nr:hypothetical protein BD324DRAFT_422671 [Kockovaella imperatae]ORX37044.1 hypothetical protein BD324DRAFT_422671 [Kockovaella imperatae]